MEKSKNRTRKKGGTTPTASEGDDYLKHWSKSYDFKNGELYEIVKRNYELYLSKPHSQNIDMETLRTDFVYSVYVDTINHPDYKLIRRVTQKNTSFIQTLLARLQIVTSSYDDFRIALNKKPSVEDTRKFRDLAKEMYSGEYKPTLITNGNHTPKSVAPTIPTENSHPTKPKSATPTKLPKSRKSAKAVSATKRRQRGKDCFAYATARSITRTFTLLGLTTEETVNMIYDAIYCVILKYGPGDCQKGGFVLASVITVLDFFTKDADNDFADFFELNYDMISPICKFGVCKHGHILHFSTEHKTMFVGRLKEIIKRNILEIKKVYEVFSKTGKNKPPQTIYEALLSRYQPIITTSYHAMVLRKWNHHEVECIDSNKSDYIERHIMKVNDIRDICTYNNSYYKCQLPHNNYIIKFCWIHIHEFDDEMVHIRDSIYLPTDIASPSYDLVKPILTKVFSIPDELKPTIDVTSKFTVLRLRYKHILMCGFNCFGENHDILIGYLKNRNTLYFGIIKYLIESDSTNIDDPYIHLIQRIDDIVLHGYNKETVKIRLTSEPHQFDAIIAYVSKRDDRKDFVFMKNVKSLYQLE
jgi:hypothetical protein